MVKVYYSSAVVTIKTMNPFIQAFLSLCFRLFAYKNWRTLFASPFNGTTVVNAGFLYLEPYKGTEEELHYPFIPRVTARQNGEYLQGRRLKDNSLPMNPTRPVLVKWLIQQLRNLAFEAIAWVRHCCWVHWSSDVGHLTLFAKKTDKCCLSQSVHIVNLIVEVLGSPIYIK